MTFLTEKQVAQILLWINEGTKPLVLEAEKLGIVIQPTVPKNLEDIIWLVAEKTKPQHPQT